MRKMSKKQRKMIDDNRTAREQFLLDCPQCAMGFGSSTDVHEILAGAHRKPAYQDRCCWLAVSRRGHEFVQGAPLAFQLALKIMQDPAHFSRSKVCELCGRADTAVTDGEIIQQLKDIYTARKAPYRGCSCE